MLPDHTRNTQPRTAESSGAPRFFALFSSSMSSALQLVLALALTACRAAPPAGQVAPAAVGAARFPGAAAVLAGFDPAQAGAAWRTGDRVLYALSTESGARARAQLIELELLGACTLGAANDSAIQLAYTVGLNATIGNRKVEWTSRVLRVAVRVYEADGRLVQHTEAKVPETVLQSGMQPALELFPQVMARSTLAGGAQPVELSDPEVRVMAEALAMLPTLLGILQDDGVLEPLLRQAIGPLPLLSPLGGIQIGLNVDFEKASAVAEPDVRPCVSGPVYRLPLHIGVNDHPQLELELEVAAAAPPLRLSGGILALRGSGLRDPERRVTFELLAARRGLPGAEIRR